MKINHHLQLYTKVLILTVGLLLSACNRQEETPIAIPAATASPTLQVNTPMPPPTARPTAAPTPTEIVDLCPALSDGDKKHASHPLDALTSHEISCTVAILQNEGLVDSHSHYPTMTLKEPAKSAVLGWQRGDDLPRTAFAVVRQGLQIFETVVDIKAQSVLSWKEMQNVETNILAAESGAAQKILFDEPAFQEALTKRGFTEFQRQVQCIAISVGSFGLPEEVGTRLIGVPCFDKRGDGSYWGRPIEGLLPIVDLNAGVLFKFIDTGSVPIADSSRMLEDQVDDIPPIEFAYPGSALDVDPSWVQWQNWSFHLRFDQRVGTIISLATFQDGETQRPILYQGALSEIFVPYMDPAETWYRRTFLDAGEYGFGVSATILEIGVDCPAEADYHSAQIVGDNGTAYSVPGAICIFERTHGDPAWRHYDPGVGQMHERRFATELVVRMLGSVGNYDYYLDWIFTEDGRIRTGVGSTGIVLTKGVTSTTMTDETALVDTAYGTLIAPNIVAPNHDHFFNFRLDLDVDGVENSFVKGKLVSTALTDDHPRRSIWTVEQSVAERESQAKLQIDPTAPTMYHVINPNMTGQLGHSPSYSIRPIGTIGYSLLHPDDYPQMRAGFVDYHIWVTPYTPDERYAAGDYVFQSQGGDGLPAWTEADRPIENTDIVLWYTMGFHHLPRLEDWPIMPLHWQHFELVPFNFFDGNPTIEREAE